MDAQNAKAHAKEERKRAKNEKEKTVPFSVVTTLKQFNQTINK